MLDQSGNLRLGELSVALDRGGALPYLSHAHSDHTSGMRASGRIIASEETLALASFSKCERISHTNIKLLNAGHILGSTQLFAELDGKSFAYTGDFKLRDGLTTKGAEIPECDELLIEATYGSPEIKFPPAEQLFSDMEKWVRQNSEKIILFGAYSLGKSQELIKFLNDRCGITPIVHHRVEHFCKIYGQFGIALSRAEIGTLPAAELMRGAGFCAIMPTGAANSQLSSKLREAYRKPVLTALATGWGMCYDFPVDKVFPMSDHADFAELVSYVEAANPKKIWCSHGEEERLASALRKKGYGAHPLSGLKEKELAAQTRLL